MKKSMFGIVFMFLLLLGKSIATPSTTYWTPCVYDIQPYGVWHLGVDDYFSTLGTDVGAFSTDVGLTVGILPYQNFQMEVGIDYLGGTAAMAPVNPVYFNAKIGTPPDSLFAGSPALNLGIFNVGTNKGVTDQNIWHFVAGRPTPFGRIHGGYYVGNESLLVDGTGKKANSGYMIGFDKGFMPAKDAAGTEFNRFMIAADYASGNNAFGGGGIGLYTYFTPSISFLTGPVVFNDKTLNGSWKWTTQLDINL